MIPMFLTVLLMLLMTLSMLMSELPKPPVNPRPAYSLIRGRPPSRERYSIKSFKFPSPGAPEVPGSEP
jgi:hypothetical protein